MAAYALGSNKLAMKTFTIPTRIEDEAHVEQEIRSFVKEWVGLLALRKYAHAIEALSTEIPSGSGSINSRDAMHWTPALLEAVIANYGTPEPLPGLPPLQSEPFAVVPLDSTLMDFFDENMFVDFNRSAISTLQQQTNALTATRAEQGNDRGWFSGPLSFLTGNKPPLKARNQWLGGVEFALPLNLKRGNDLSDLSVRMRFKPVASTEMALVLLDIHVL